MKTIGWPNNVNMHILSETSITTGEGGTVEDSSSNGFKNRRATSLVTPRKYNVTMDFDWGGAGSEFQFPKDEYGFTEYDRFERWFQFQHQKGTNPFWFPCITKQSIDNLRPEEQTKMCLYKITSSLNESQSGFSQRITMTWEEVYSGIINIESQNEEAESVSGLNGKAKLVLNVIPSMVPQVTELTVESTTNNKDFTIIPINEVSCKNNVVSILYDKITEPGNYTIIVTYKEKPLNYTVRV